MIFPFIGDATNLLQVGAHAGESNNKIVTMVVGGGAPVAAAFHEMDSCDNHHDINGDSFQLTNRKQQVMCCFKAKDVNLITDRLRTPFTRTTC